MAGRLHPGGCRGRGRCRPRTGRRAGTRTPADGGLQRPARHADLVLPAKNPNSIGSCGGGGSGRGGRRRRAPALTATTATISSSGPPACATSAASSSWPHHLLARVRPLGPRGEWSFRVVPRVVSQAARPTRGTARAGPAARRADGPRHAAGGRRPTPPADGAPARCRRGRARTRRRRCRAAGRVRSSTGTADRVALRDVVEEGWPAAAAPCRAGGLATPRAAPAAGPAPVRPGQVGRDARPGARARRRRRRGSARGRRPTAGAPPTAGGRAVVGVGSASGSTSSVRDPATRRGSRGRGRR